MNSGYSGFFYHSNLSITARAMNPVFALLCTAAEDLNV